MKTIANETLIVQRKVQKVVKKNQEATFYFQLIRRLR
jgi:hypothetical protein